MRLAQERDFLAAYDVNSDALYRHIYFRVHEKELAADLLQETFMKVWRYISEGKQIENMRAFLYQTARNLVIDHYRGKKTVSLDEMAEGGFDAPDHKQVHPELAAEMSQFVLALGKIPEDYREAVTLRYLDDMTPEEIGKVLGESANAISVRIHRGVAMVRKELGLE